MDGHRLTKLVKTDDVMKKIPLIIFSSLVNEEMRKKGEQLGADAQLTKPEIGKLVEAIELATQFRAHAEIYKNLSHAEKRELDYMSDELPIYTVALFDPEEYRVKALTFERNAHKLSNSVNAKNYQIELDFDEDKYF